MRAIPPAVLIGIGPQSQQTVQRYLRCVRERWGNVPVVLPICLDFVLEESPFWQEVDGIQHLALHSPLFQLGSEWPVWLPRELAELTLSQREHARAWMRAALLERADDWQEFLLERIPRLSSFGAVEEMSARGMSLTGSSEIGVYVIADLNDELGSSVFLDVAHLTSYVCRQLGLLPLTAGMLYLPSATSPAPMEEALAYAALKELEHYLHTRSYDKELLPDLIHEDEFIPFSHGCYLLDSVNELGYTLPDESQKIAAVSEWLYAMTFLGMAGAIGEQRGRRYRTPTLRGKSRSYQGLGIAVRYVPRAALIEWSTARLGNHVIERMLDGNGSAVPEKRMHAFVERMGLGIDVIQGRLRHQSDVSAIEEALAPLRHSRVQQLDRRTRQVLDNIRGTCIPTLDRAVVAKSAGAQAEVREAVRREIEITLEDAPIGGVTLAYEFLNLLRAKVSALQAENAEQSRRHQLDLRRSLDTVSKAHYALRSARMSVPPCPVLIFGVIALLILPLVYGFQLARQVIRPLSAVWEDISLAILIAGVLIVLALVAYRLARQRHLARSQHIQMVRERFELECQPSINRAVSAVYAATQEAIAQAKADLDGLVDSLLEAVARLQSREDEVADALTRLASPGPFRSVVDLERAEGFFERAVGDLDPLIAAWVQQVGPITSWRVKCAQSAQTLVTWLDDQLSSFGSGQFEERLSDAEIAQVLAPRAVPEDLSPVVEQMLEHAHPLWNYDPRAIRRARTTKLNLLGVDTSRPAWAEFAAALPEVHPDAIPIDTSDPFAIAVLSVRRGVPLFALRRINEYRAHYAEMIRHSKLPVHTTSTLALADDLIPVRWRSKLATTALFAAGLALGVVRRGMDGRYLAVDGQNRTIRLSPFSTLLCEVFGGYHC